MTVEIILSENKIHIDSNVVSVDLLNYVHFIIHSPI
jgi:hypothetical protein